MTYIVEALVNRKNRDLDRPFWLYKAEDLSPQVGDILCKPWNETPCANLTLAGLESQFIEKKASGEYAIKGTPTGHSHTDVVVRRFSDDGTDYIETLGGNTRDLSGVAHTVGRRRWRLNANGRVDACVDRNNEVIEDCPPFAFIRIVHPTTQQLLDAAADEEGGVSV
jgi:hypothetical protein